MTIRSQLFDPVDHFAGDACRFRCAGDGAKNFLGLLLHTCVIPSRSVFNHLGVGRENMKRRQDCERGGLGADPLGQSDAVLDSLSGKFRPVRCYQDVGIIVPSSGGGLSARSVITS
jgi:hypothetical protein